MIMNKSKNSKENIPENDQKTSSEGKAVIQEMKDNSDLPGIADIVSDERYHKTAVIIKSMKYEVKD